MERSFEVTIESLFFRNAPQVAIAKNYRFKITVISPTGGKASLSITVNSPQVVRSIVEQTPFENSAKTEEVEATSPYSGMKLIAIKTTHKTKLTTSQMKQMMQFAKAAGEFVEAK